MKFTNRYKLLILVLYIIICLIQKQNQLKIIKTTAEKTNIEPSDFFSQMYYKYIDKFNYNLFLDECIKIANLEKMNDYLTKSKIKKSSASSFANVYYLSDLLQSIKAINNNDVNIKDLLKGVESNSSSSSKEETLVISLFAKLSFDKKIYSPIAVSDDAEQLKGNWKAYVILMAKEGLDNKLMKICFNPIHKSLFIKLNYDEECSSIINELENKDVFAEKDTVKLELNKLKNDSSKISFLEKSSTTTETEESATKKNFSVSQLMEKFSVDELNKIKAIIKFAKKNDITNKVFENKGDISLEELVLFKNPNFKTNSSTEDIKKQDERFNTIETLLKDIKSEVNELKTKLNKTQENDSKTQGTPPKKIINEAERLLSKPHIDDYDDDFESKPSTFVSSPTTNNYSRDSSRVSSANIPNSNSSSNFSSTSRKSAYANKSLKPKTYSNTHTYSTPKANVQTSKQSFVQKNTYLKQKQKQVNSFDDDDDTDMFSDP